MNRNQKHGDQTLFRFIFPPMFTEIMKRTEMNSCALSEAMVLTVAVCLSMDKNWLPFVADNDNCDYGGQLLLQSTYPVKEQKLP